MIILVEDAGKEKRYKNIIFDDLLIARGNYGPIDAALVQATRNIMMREKIFVYDVEK